MAHWVALISCFLSPQPDTSLQLHCKTTASAVLHRLGCLYFLSSRWCSLHLPTEGWPGWIDLGDWLHTGMVYPPVNQANVLSTHCGSITSVKLQFDLEGKLLKGLQSLLPPKIWKIIESSGLKAEKPFQIISPTIVANFGLQNKLENFAEKSVEPCF